MFNKSIAYVQYANPAAYPPLEHSSRIFAREGWEVLFLGIPALGAESLSFPRHDRIKVRQISFCQAGWRQKLHYVQFCLWVLFSVLRWRSRWVYASDLMSCPVALILSFLPGFRVIYHEHDSPTLETRDRISKISKFMRLVLWARRRLARRAQLCVLPNERRAERFRAELGSVMCNGYRSTVVVWNCPSLEEVSEPRDAHDGSELWVLYHGSIVPSRLPLTVFEAVAILPEAVKLRVIGYETLGHEGYVQRLRQCAIQLGISERVEFIGPMPRRTLLHWCRKCDVGLAFFSKRTEDINQQTMVGASNKPFDYAACGLALLVSDLSDWRQIYVDGGYGLACDADDPQSIAATLHWFLDHPIEMRAMGERGRRKIEKDWNYESQSKPLLELLQT